MSQEIVLIKPVVLFGIGEHYKRKTIQLRNSNFLIVGSLYGNREGLTVRVSFSTPIKVTEEENETKIQKGPFNKYFTQSDKLVRIDHPGNNLRSLQLVGLYVLRKNLKLIPQDEELFNWLAQLGFENQRLLLINFEKKHQIHVWKRDHNKLVEVPFSNMTETSQTICIKGLTQKSKVSPYLKTLQSNKNLIANYNVKLLALKRELEKETNLEKLRELSTLINNLKQLTEDKTILQELDSAVVFNFAVALNLQKKQIL